MEEKEIDPNACFSQNCLLMPSNHYKLYWDMFITIVLLASCVLTPV